MLEKKITILTGASHGVGAGLVGAFLKEGQIVVATRHSRYRSEVSRLFASNAMVTARLFVTNLQGRRITSPDARYPSGTPIEPEICNQQERLSTLGWPLGRRIHQSRQNH